jgi:hypothetical protein
MDAQVDRAMNEILNQEGVTGVLFADVHGLCISAKGDAHSLTSGFLTALISRSEELGDDPTVCIETDGHNIFIKKVDDMTVVVNKKSS